MASFFTQPVRKFSHVTMRPLIRADVRRPQFTTMADQARSPGAVLRLREGVFQTNADTQEMGLPSITIGAYAVLMQSNAIRLEGTLRGTFPVLVAVVKDQGPLGGNLTVCWAAEMEGKQVASVNLG